MMVVVVFSPSLLFQRVKMLLMMSVSLRSLQDRGQDDDDDVLVAPAVMLGQML